MSLKYKSFSIALIFCLVVGFAVTGSVEFELSTDLDKQPAFRTSFDTMKPELDLFAEGTFAKKKWGQASKKTFGLSSIGLGAKGPEKTPFYGITKFNFDRSNDFGLSDVEVGGGVVFPALAGMKFGGEVTIENPTILELKSIKGSLFLRYSFASFPTTPDT